MTDETPSSTPTLTTSTGFAVVAGAAALWGTAGLFRGGLLGELPATTVVFSEHLILVVLTAPLLLRGVRRARATFTSADTVSLVVIGVGASAVATVLFTAAFAYGEPNTPLLLQQLQPVIAVIAARVVLGERFSRRYPLAFVAAVTGAWLVAFADPLDVGITDAMPAVLALAAASLWAMGTVLGRRLTAKVPFAELAALRFGMGLPATAVLLPVWGGGAALGSLGSSDVAGLLLLALIPGLLGLVLYYRGLRGTPAAAATLAELAFPLSSLVVNYLAFGDTLTVSQAVGLLLLAGTITTMGLAHRRGPQAVGVTVPANA